MLTHISQLLGQAPESKSYADKLRDPQWEARRRSFVATHGRYCWSCKRTNIPVHVHHKVYRRGLEPWEHQDADLVLLCAGCHNDWHDLLQEFRGQVIGSIPVYVARVIIRALSLLLRFNEPRSVGFALAQLAAEPKTVTHLSARFQADEERRSANA